MVTYQRLFYNSQLKRWEYETLYVKGNGNIVCDTCVNGLFNKERDTKSYCLHAKQLEKDLKDKNMKGWNDVTPRKQRGFCLAIDKDNLI